MLGLPQRDSGGEIRGLGNKSGGGGEGRNKSGRLFSVLTRQGRGMRLHAPSRWILLLGLPQRDSGGEIRGLGNKSGGGGGGEGRNKSGRLFSVLTRQGRGMRLHAPSRWILLLGLPH